jgi:lipopolysaccharide assembly outer membrane protein LptD (OstA)
MMTTSRLPILVAALCLVSAAGVVDASDSAQISALEARTIAAAKIDPNAPIEATADEMNYDRATGRMYASGNVKISQNGATLTADRVNVNVETGDAFALGNVVLTRGDDVVTGEKMRYNFKTGKGDGEGTRVTAEPFHVASEHVERGHDGLFHVRGARASTCANEEDHWHYSVRLKELSIAPGEYMSGRGATMYAGKVPFMYLPRWRKDLDESTGWNLRPGYSSRLGAYLLVGYRQKLTPAIKATHQANLYSKRGLGLSETVEWQRGDEFKGALELFYIDDQDPWEANEDPLTSPVAPERYRIHARHGQSLTDNAYIYGQGTYLSDPAVEEDFFESFYRQSRQPENYVSLTHRQDLYTVNLLAQARLNDFYENVDRIPEVSVDINRARITPDAGLYYDSSHTVVNLQQRFANDREEEYGTGRFDTQNRLYYPGKYFGWLNINPRAVFQGTYYSETAERHSSSSVDTNGVTNVVHTLQAGAAGFRPSLSIGAELSFKAYNIFGPDDASRHIVEPYLDYSYRPEPTITPEDLYQFDRIDELDKLHAMRLGIRNKVQRKRKASSYDAINADTYFLLNIEPDAGEKNIQDFVWNIDLLPADWFLIELDGNYDFQTQLLENVNSRATFRRHDQARWRGYLEHRFSETVSNLLRGGLTYQPNERWALDYYGRYEFESGRLEEQGGYVERSLDCLSFRVGGSMLPGYTSDDGVEREDEYRVLFEVWLRAFPEFRARSKTGI